MLGVAVAVGLGADGLNLGVAPSGGSAPDLTVASVTLTPSSQSGATGDVLVFFARALNAAGDGLPGKVFTAVSVDPDAVTLSVSGHRVSVTLAEGRSTTVTASSGGHTSAAVTVTNTDDPALTLPAIASLADGEWWDSTSGLTSPMWTGRQNGLVLTKKGSPLIVPNALNGRPVARLDAVWNGAAASQGYRGSVSPIGLDPSAFTTWSLTRPTLARIPNGIGQAFVIAGAPNGLSYQESGGLANEGSADLTFYADLENEAGDGFDDGEATLSEIGAVLGGLLLCECVHIDANTTHYYVNGIGPLDQPEVTHPISGFQFNRTAIGGFWYDEESYYEQTGFVGDVAMAGGAPAAFSTNDRQKLYDWVTAAYGLTLPAAV